MKKLLVSIFAVFYLGLSCGFAFDMHFCMGKFSSVELFHTSDKKCGKCGMKNKNGCCESKVTFVKITDNQQLSSSGIIIISPLTTITQYYISTFLPHISLYSNASFTDTSPPPISGSFLRILNCTFTI
jgi:hypothetical protein